MNARDGLLQRMIVGSAALLLFFALCFFAHAPYFGWVFTAALSLISGIALWEYYELVACKQGKPLVQSGIWFATLYLFSCYAALGCPAGGGFFLPQLVLCAFLFWVFAAQLSYGPVDAIAHLSSTLFGFAYIVLPLSSLLLITYCPSQEGRLWLLYVVLVTKITDIGGFIIGKTVGYHPMAFISPKKTWEGAVGGALCSVAMSLALQQMSIALVGQERFFLGWIESMILGLGIAAAAQFGDFAESLLKRDAKVKDSSTLPGLGGVLDVLDSLIFPSLVVYFYLGVSV